LQPTLFAGKSEHVIGLWMDRVNDGWIGQKAVLMGDKEIGTDRVEQVEHYRTRTFSTFT